MSLALTCCQDCVAFNVSGNETKRDKAWKKQGPRGEFVPADVLPVIDSVLVAVLCVFLKVCVCVCTCWFQPCVSLQMPGLNLALSCWFFVFFCFFERVCDGLSELD